MSDMKIASEFAERSKQQSYPQVVHIKSITKPQGGQKLVPLKHLENFLGSR